MRSVQGRLVTRWGTRPSLFVGAAVTTIPGEKPRVEWSEEPVRIPEAEYRRYRREYDRALAAGDLCLVTQEPHVPRRISQ